MLTHIRIDEDNRRRSLYKCDCGNFTIAFRSNVVRGTTKSCGCYAKKLCSERSLKHGHKKNDDCRTKVYIAWQNMKARCDNPNRKDSKNYIDRGISYVPEWSKFECFLRDMGEPDIHLTLDRVDNSKGYSKENCRWVSMKIQALNKRNNKRYSMEGESLTLTEWSRKNNIGRITMLKRIQRGVPLEVALTHKGYLRTSNASTNNPS